MNVPFLLNRSRSVVPGGSGARRPCAGALALALAFGAAAAWAQIPDGPPPGSPAGPPAGGPVEPGVTGDAAPPAPAAETPATAAMPRSSRDPFWPVGYVPPPAVKPGAPSVPGPAGSRVAVAVETARPPDWDEARRRLEIKGISRIGRDRTSGQQTYFADVNGRIVEDGDVVSVNWDGRLYRWRISRITPNGLQLTKLDSRTE